MGMYDTFEGKINCPICKKDFIFSEQTKGYECFLQTFKLGDYIDKGNRNYFYSFTYECPVCKQDIKIYIGIRRGQIIGFFTDITNLNILDMDNIEDGYQRNLEYKEMCEIGCGFDKCVFRENPYNIGETIHTLNRDWIVQKIFKEKLEENNENETLSSFYKSLYVDNYCYQVQDNDGNERFIVTRRQRPTLIIDGSKKIESTYNQPYNSQLGTTLVEFLQK